MQLRIRYTVRGDWTTVQIRRVDGETREEGRALYRTTEWSLLLGKLGCKGPLGIGGEVTLPMGAIATPLALAKTDVPIVGPPAVKRAALPGENASTFDPGHTT